MHTRYFWYIPFIGGDNESYRAPNVLEVLHLPPPPDKLFFGGYFHSKTSVNNEKCRLGMFGILIFAAYSSSRG